MKKLFSALLACILAVVCAISFTACNSNEENYSETFTGVVSEQTFETKEEAAREFLVQELCADDVEIIYLAYTRIDNLTDKEIASLNLSEDDRANLRFTEKGYVSYNVSEIEEYTVSGAAALLGHGEQKVYMLQINSVYKYYVPLPEVGERLTKSYIDSVIEFSQYHNCTIETNYEDSDAESYSNTAKVVDNLLMTTGGYWATSWTLCINDEDFIIVSIESGEYVRDIEYNMSTSYPEIGYDYISALDRALIEQITMFSYIIAFRPYHYIKTEYGFSLDISSLPEWWDYVEELSVYVSEGVVSKLVWRESFDGFYTYEVKIYDFGKTEIDLPAEVEKLLYQ